MWLLGPVGALTCVAGLLWAGIAEAKPAANNFVVDLILGQVLNIYAPTSRAVENEQCRNHSLIYRQAAQHKLQWALQMLDSNSKIPSGIIKGNGIDFGNYDECLEVEDVATPSGRFSGQYCLVNVRGASPGHSPDDINLWGLLDMAVHLVIKTKSQIRLVESIFKMAGFTIAVCVPSTCTPRDLELHLQHELQGLFGNMSISVTVGESTCYTRANIKPFKAADWFAVCFVVFFATLAILSTGYDLATRKSESRNSILISFSVYSNCGKLLKPPPSDSDTLQALHGIRFLSMTWVVMGHSLFIFSFMTPSINFAKNSEYISEWNQIHITNATLCVDSFLVLSGLLICYLFLNEMEKGKPFNIPLYYFHRYIRLTPAYGAMILLTATLLIHMGEGPYWGRYILNMKDACQENWWTNLLFINNYYHVDSACLAHTWYIAVDMHLFWLSPLILYPLWKWPRFGNALVALLIVVGLLITFLIAYTNEISFQSIEAGGPNGKIQYYPTHVRYIPWLIGVGLGYLLHSTKGKRVQLSPVTVTVGWLLSAALMLTSLYLALEFLQPEHTYNRLFESLYTCLQRPAWALGLAWVIFACTTGYGGFVNSFLSWRLFQVLGRLTYTTYLTHVPVLYYVASSKKTAGYLSNQTAIMQFLSELIVSICCAFVLSITLESPGVAIEKVLFKKVAKGKKQSGITKKKMKIKELTPYDGSKKSSVQIISMTVMEDFGAALQAKPRLIFITDLKNK